MRKKKKITRESTSDEMVLGGYSPVGYMDPKDLPKNMFNPSAAPEPSNTDSSTGTDDNQ